MLKININLLFNVINILVLCVLIRQFLLKPVRKILEKRQAEIDRSLSDAEAAKMEALALERQHKESMQGIEDEKLAVLAEAQKRAAEEYDVLVTDAKQKAGGIIKNAEVEAASRKEEILRQANDEIKEIVIAATAMVSGVGSRSDSALYDEFLKKAGSSDGENGN